MAWYTKLLAAYEDEALARVLARYKTRAAMLRAWGTFDWSGLEDALFESFERPLVRYLAAHKQAVFTRLAVDANADYGDALLSLDSSNERDRLPGDYDHRDIVARLSAYKSWKQEYLKTRELIGEVETLDDVFDEMEEDDLPDADEFSATFLQSCARTAIRLELVARAKSNAAEIEALAWDHDDRASTARTRMATVRKQKRSARKKSR